MNFHGFVQHYLDLSDQFRISFQTNFTTHTTDELASQKPLIVFNYGLVCSYEHFRPQIEFFNQLDYPVLIHNYRGHFDSHFSGDLKTIHFENLAKDTWKILDYINAQKVIIFGHSMGVNVTLEMAKLRPKQTLKIALISGTHLSIRSILMHNQNSGFFLNVLANIFEKFPTATQFAWDQILESDIVSFIVHQQGFHTPTVNRKFVKDYMNRIRYLGLDVFLQLIQQMVVGQEEITSEIESRALIIYGDDDKVLPIESQIKMKDSLKDAHEIVIHRGSHVPQIDFPKILNQHLLDFVTF